MIINFPGHTRFHCNEKTCEGCQFCRGGLFCCVRCGGFEGALTTDCPGHRLRMETHDVVYAGLWDYRRGQWVEAASKHSPRSIER